METQRKQMLAPVPAADQEAKDKDKDKDAEESEVGHHDLAHISMEVDAAAKERAQRMAADLENSRSLICETFLDEFSKNNAVVVVQVATDGATGATCKIYVARDDNCHELAKLFLDTNDLPMMYLDSMTAMLQQQLDQALALLDEKAAGGTAEASQAARVAESPQSEITDSPASAPAPAAAASAPAQASAAASSRPSSTASGPPELSRLVPREDKAKRAKGSDFNDYYVSEDDFRNPLVIVTILEKDTTTSRIFISDDNDTSEASCRPVAAVYIQTRQLPDKYVDPMAKYLLKKKLDWLISNPDGRKRKSSGGSDGSVSSSSGSTTHSSMGKPEPGAGPTAPSGLTPLSVQGFGSHHASSSSSSYRQNQTTMPALSVTPQRAGHMQTIQEHADYMEGSEGDHDVDDTSVLTDDAASSHFSTHSDNSHMYYDQQHGHVPYSGRNGHHHNAAHHKDHRDSHQHSDNGYRGDYRDGQHGHHGQHSHHGQYHGGHGGRSGSGPGSATRLPHQAYMPLPLQAAPNSGASSKPSKVRVSTVNEIFLTDASRDDPLTVVEIKESAEDGNKVSHIYIGMEDDVLERAQLYIQDVKNLPDKFVPPMFQFLERQKRDALHKQHHPDEYQLL
jgi:hypothetical protein